MNSERIVFLGTPDISAYLLEGMVKAGFNIVGVITREDKPKGRKGIPTPSPVGAMALKLGLPLHKPHKLNLDYSILDEWKPDLLLTFAYGQIISTKVLSYSKYKPLNLHASLLPKYRGAAPLQYALRNGDKETGISLMEMVKEMDAGDVYAVEKLPIDKDDNYTSLCEKIQKLALEMAIKDLPLYFENKLTPVKQDPAQVTFCPSIKKEQEHLILDQTPEGFANEVRALSYTPGGYLLRKDNTILKIYKAEPYSADIKGEPGQILLARKNDIILQLTKGQVRLLILQKPGKKMMKALDFNNGTHDFEGEILH